jgi:hypothetical protein
MLLLCVRGDGDTDDTEGEITCDGTFVGIAGEDPTRVRRKREERKKSDTMADIFFDFIIFYLSSFTSG